MLRKRFLFTVCLWLVLSATAALGWTGRMSGMADPRGLVQDDSDFLAIPSLLAREQENRFVLSYAFGLSDVSSMDASIVTFPWGAAEHRLHGDASSHTVQLGGIRTSEVGNFGIFLTAGLEDATQRGSSQTALQTYDSEVTRDLRNAVLNMYYARPGQHADFGASLGVEYVDRFTKTEQSGPKYVLNYIWGGMFPVHMLNFFGLPEDSTAWKADGSLSMSRDFGHSELSLVLGGAALLSGESAYDFQENNLAGGVDYAASTYGDDMEGYSARAEVRYVSELQDGWSLPVLVRAEYSYWNTEGSGIGTGLLDAGMAYLTHFTRENLSVTAGAGFNREWGQSLVAGGLYGSVSQSTDSAFVDQAGIGADYSDHPRSNEYRITARLACETPISPRYTFNAGVSVYKGWIQGRYRHYDGMVVRDISLNGGTSGGLAAIGLAYSGENYDVETFLNVGYAGFSTTGDGVGTVGFATRIGLRQSSTSVKAGAALLF